MTRNTFLLFLIFACFIIEAKEFPVDTISFLALGDSYTIGQSVDSTMRWPVQLVDSLKSKGRTIDDFQIRAMTGWTTTALLSSLASDQNAKQYNAVALLIGVNNFYQGRPESVYVEEFQQLLDSAVKFCSLGEEGVFVVSIPDYGYTPFGEANQAMISEQTDRYNFIGDSISAINGIQLINITDISREWTSAPELVAADQLHPSGKQYSKWVTRILQNNVQSAQDRSKGSMSFPGLTVRDNLWQFDQELIVTVLNWSGQVVYQKTVVRGEVIDLSAVNGSVMDVRSKSHRWSKVLQKLSK